MNTNKIKTLLSTASIGLFMAATPAISGPVTLTSVDGSTKLTGDFVRMDDGFFIVETTIGQMRVGVDMVTCEGESCPVPAVKDMAVYSSPTLAHRLMPTLLAGYSKHVNGQATTLEETETLRQVQLSSDDLGEADVSVTTMAAASTFEGLFTGAANFALTTRAANKRELAAAKEAGIEDLRSGVHEHVIGYDGLLLVANPENPIRAISELAASRIFSGEVTNWAQLGGPNAPINVYVREEGSGARTLFDELVMRSNRAKMSSTVTELASDEAVAKAVREDANGFGFTSMVYASAHVKPLDIEGVCGLRTPANAFTIKTGEYPLTRPLYLYAASGDLGGHAESFMSYVTSDEGQEMVAEAGFVGQAISSEVLNAQGMRVAATLLQDDEQGDISSIRNMLNMLLSSERLSTTVRFTQGSTSLGASAEADVQRLGEMLKTEKYADKELYFMGFSDSVGRADLNQLLALQRAELVRKTLLEMHPDLKDRVKVRSVGFGEISPLGCNETRTGRSINRRVEVWMQDRVAGDAKL